METTGNISINVFEKNKEKIEKSSNGSEAFLIISNEELNNKNREYLLELEKLKNENESLEDQNDKHENSTRYMRGILHNFTEKVKNQDNLINHYKTYHSNLKDFTKEITNLVKTIYDFYMKFAFIYNATLLIILFSGGITIGSIIINNLILGLSIGMTFAVTQLDYKLIVNIEDKVKKTNDLQKRDKLLIDSELKKIAEIDKSNNFIEDYIDVV